MNKPLKILAFAALLFFSCSAPNKISVYDLSYLYDREGNFSDLDCSIYHDTDTTSTAFVLVRLNDLFYKKPTFSSNYQASYRISYRLMNAYDSKDVIDSLSQSHIDSVNFGKELGLIHALRLPATYDNNYILALELQDVYRQETIKDFFAIEKESPRGSQNFIAIDDSKKPLFKSYVDGDQEVKVKCNDASLDRLFVRVYHRDFPVASPPFVTEKDVTFDYRADSVYEVSLFNGETSYFSLKQKGFYHFMKDTLTKEGMTLFRFNDDYPAFTNASDLVEPLRFITSRKEYTDIETSDDPKGAIDLFWINTAGNETRARNLIKRYYTGVKEANKYFSSYHEGWKTDRGLIYIIFGRPKFVYRGEDQEDWVYGDPENRNSIRFTFARVKNPFTYNDFMLLRTPTLKDPWYITVQSWRR